MNKIMRRAKIVATIGPASDSEQALESLINAGMNVARLNFSHGTHEQHALRVAAIRAVSNKLGMPIGILQDLQGPKIRVGKLAAPLQLSSGEQVTLFSTQDEPPKTDNQLLPVDFRELFDSVQAGDRLLLDDGALRLQWSRLRARCPCESFGRQRAFFTQRDNLPGVKLRIAGFTEKIKLTLLLAFRRVWMQLPYPSCAVRRMSSRADAMQAYSKDKRVPL